MKKFFALVLALVMALSLTTVAWGATTHSVSTAAELIELLDNDGTGDVQNGDVIMLTGDVEVTALVNITEDVTINLNGHKLSRDNGGSVVMVKNDATLTILGTTPGSTFYGRINLGEATNNNGNLVIDGGTYSCANGQTVLHVNGTCLDSDASIYGAAITSPTDNAIQFNGAGTFVIDNCVITGATGIYMKAGTLSVTNTTVTANGAKVAPTPNGDGSNTTGDALVMDTMTGYAGDMKVTLGAGNTFASTNGYAIQESNTANAASSAVISLVITNGSYTGAAGAIEATDKFNDAVEVGTITASISGGTFSSDVSAYMAAGVTQTTTGVIVSSSTHTEFDTKDAKTLAVKGTKALTLIPAKGAYVATATGNWVGGWVKHYVDEYGVEYVPCTADVDGALIVYYKGTNSVYDTVVAANPFYEAVATEFTSFGTACGQLDNRADTTAKYYTYADGNGIVYLNKGTTATAKQVMVNGKLVGVEAANLIGNLNAHKWVVEKNAKNEVTKATCSLCGQQASWTLNLASVPTGATFVPAPGGGFLYWNAAPVVDTDTKVESAETFDAGIALYVGMSVMAAAGSAVVLKKRED